MHMNFIHTERCRLCPHVGESACGRAAGEVQDPPQRAAGLGRAGLLFLINKNNSKNIYIYIETGEMKFDNCWKSDSRMENANESRSHPHAARV